MIHGFKAHLLLRARFRVLRRVLSLIPALLLGLHCTSVLASNNAEDAQLDVTGRIHFNVNVSNFERSRGFYKLLGFDNSIRYPATNTLEVAQAMGIDHTYLLRAELLFRGEFSGGFIDLIEWTNPRNDEPPAPNLYRLGIASATLLSTDLDADITQLKAGGVTFSSAPVPGPDGRRFVIFKDPDGTYFELLEAQVTAAGSDGALNISGLGKINLNVSNLERSREFYEVLGFVAAPVLELSGDAATAEALGVDSSYAFRKVLMHHHSDGSAIELTQWLQPSDATPPFPAPINHLGIHRIAYSTNDMDGDISKLKALDVPFLSEAAPCCEGPDSEHGIVVFMDPDGIFFELVDTPENYWDQMKGAFQK